MSVQEFHSAHLLLDSNLAVLLCVGMAGPDRIAKHKRLSTFDAEEFRILAEIVGSAKRLTFSPHILTETSNLIS